MTYLDAYDIFKASTRVHTLLQAFLCSPVQKSIAENWPEYFGINRFTKVLSYLRRKLQLTVPFICRQWILDV